MKNLVLLAVLLMGSLASRSQVIKVVNNSHCSIDVIAAASDGNPSTNPPSNTCNSKYWTIKVNIPVGGTYTFQQGDLPMQPSVMPFFWTRLRFYDPSINCQGGVPSGSCGYGGAELMNPTCGGTTSACLERLSCSPCAGMFANGQWSVLNSQSAVVTITD